MYRRVKTQKKFEALSGIDYKPIATLKDPHGGVCHVVEDDGCYVAFLNVDDVGFVPVVHIFPELHSVLCELESLEQPAEAA